MIPYSVYKIVHLVGILMVFTALGGLIANAIGQQAKTHAWRKPIAITHGVGLLLALVGGFGLLARLGVAHNGLPGWIYAKLGIWLVFGALLGVVARKPEMAKGIWVVIVLLGGLAAYLAGSKPF
ncbi:MAG: hypothetical protein AB7F86_00670 [Bdellovibrionales bacterium]